LDEPDGGGDEERPQGDEKAESGQIPSREGEREGGPPECLEGHGKETI
jgi:hypothetical protein